MTILLSVPGTVTWATNPVPTQVAVPGTVTIESLSIDQPNVEGTITWDTVDPFVSTVAGEGPEPQAARFEVIVDGTTIDPAQITNMLVTEPRRGRKTAVFTVPRSLAQGWGVYTSPPTLGHITQRLAPVPGKLEVAVRGVYLSSAGRKIVVPLVTAGLADQTTEVADASQDLTTISIVDRGGRYVNRRGSLTLPPGHNLTRAEAVRRHAVELGATDIALSSTKKTTKPVEILDADLSWAEEYLDTEGRDLRWGRSGSLTCPIYGPASGRARDWTLGADRIRVDVGLSLSSPGQVPTRGRITGRRQLADDECETRTEIQIVNTFAPFAPVIQPQRQSGIDGTFSSVSVFTSTENQAIGRVETFRTLQCDRVLVERVRTWGWKNPIASRYTLDSDETINGYVSNVYGPAGIVKDDGTEVYLWSKQRWCLLDDTATRHYYDDEGYLIERVTWKREWQINQHASRGPHVFASGTWDDQPLADSNLPVLADLSPIAIPITPGQQIAGEWFPGAGGGNREAGAYRTQPPSPGEGLDGVAQPPLYPLARVPDLHITSSLGRERPSAGNPEILRWSSVKFELFRQAGGFKTEEEGIDYKWRRVKGGAYIYRDGKTSREEDEEPGVDLVIEKRWLAESDTSHTEIVSETKTDEGTKATPTFGKQGYLPAATRDESVPAQDPDDLPDAVRGRRGSVQEMIHECIRGDLERYYIDRWIDISSAWAEDEAELEFVCLQHLREGSKCEVSIPVMGANFFMKAGDRALVVYPRLNLDHDVYFDTVRWSQQDHQSPIVTDVDSDLYVI